jgi:histidinol-phosphate aminotransferase
MSLSRRHFVHTLGAGAASSLIAPLHLPELEWVIAPASAVRLDRNENPNGPAKEAIQAITLAAAESSRYPDELVTQLTRAVADTVGVAEFNVVLTCGSTDVIRSAVYGFTSPTRGLVTAAPSYESPGNDAQRIKTPVVAVPVTSEIALDLPAMATASHGAGLVYLCNPNNPTGTVHSGDDVKACIAKILADTPDATILVDEAYHEYVEDPKYATMIPLALQNPRVIVSRTFSKVFGMAGLRVGYAIGQPETLEHIRQQRLAIGVNRMGAVAALASLGLKSHIEREHAKNKDAREWTQRELASFGYPSVPSHTNFIMVDVRQDAKAFREACKAQNVLVGRPFPPLNTYARVSIGTMDDMHRAMDVFRHILPKATVSRAG